MMSDQEFCEAVTMARPPMRQVAARIVGDLDADDAVQSAILNAWRWRHSWNRSASSKTWLTAIARNAALDILRKEKSRPRRTGDSVQEEAILASLPDCHDNPEQLATLTQFRICLSVSLGDLPHGMRNSFERWLAGESLVDSTSKTQAFRAKLRIVPRIREQMSGA